MISQIDELWAEFSTKDIEQLMGPPADQDYGVRDFSVIAPTAIKSASMNLFPDK